MHPVLLICVILIKCSKKRFLSSHCKRNFKKFKIDCDESSSTQYDEFLGNFTENPAIFRSTENEDVITPIIIQPQEINISEKEKNENESIAENEFLQDIEAHGEYTKINFVCESSEVFIEKITDIISTSNDFSSNMITENYSKVIIIEPLELNISQPLNIQLSRSETNALQNENLNSSNGQESNEEQIYISSDIRNSDNSKYDRPTVKARRSSVTEIEQISDSESEEIVDVEMPSISSSNKKKTIYMFWREYFLCNTQKGCVNAIKRCISIGLRDTETPTIREVLHFWETLYEKLGTMVLEISQLHQENEISIFENEITGQESKGRRTVNLRRPPLRYGYEECVGSFNAWNTVARTIRNESKIYDLSGKDMLAFKNLLIDLLNRRLDSNSGLDVLFMMPELGNLSSSIPNDINTNECFALYLLVDLLFMKTKLYMPNLKFLFGDLPLTLVGSSQPALILERANSKSILFEILDIIDNHYIINI